MAREIQYEVFRRVGAKGGWTLHEVVTKRDVALTMAQELMAGEKATGVKVVKETYNDETGDFLTLKIFEEGHNQVKLAPAQESIRTISAEPLPCTFSATVTARLASTTAPWTSPVLQR